MRAHIQHRPHRTAADGHADRLTIPSRRIMCLRGRRGASFASDCLLHKIYHPVHGQWYQRFADFAAQAWHILARDRIFSRYLCGDCAHSPTRARVFFRRNVPAGGEFFCPSPAHSPSIFCTKKGRRYANSTPTASLLNA